MLCSPCCSAISTPIRQGLARPDSPRLVSWPDGEGALWRQREEVVIRCRGLDHQPSDQLPARARRMRLVRRRRDRDPRRAVVAHDIVRTVRRAAVPGPRQCRPGLPVAPVGPVAPGAPLGPASPCGPAGPSSPRGPWSPRGPGGPSNPCGPAGPSSPRGPCSPREPAGPAGPVAPIGPGSPGSPSMPVAPGGPAGPFVSSSLRNTISKPAAS